MIIILIRQQALHLGQVAGSTTHLNGASASKDAIVGEKDILPLLYHKDDAHHQRGCSVMCLERNSTKSRPFSVAALFLDFYAEDNLGQETEILSRVQLFYSMQ